MKRTLGCGIVAIVLVVLVLVPLLWGVGVYSRMVTRDVAVSSAWAQVENVYQRRMDLIPNLVETVKGAANFEKGTLQAVVDARARASQMVLTPELLNDPSAFKAFREAQGELTGALSRLLATVENYPDLKATQNFADLQVQLESTENRIAVARRDFNTAVQDYNTSIRVFPALLVAKICDFRPKAFFEATEGADKPPQVKF